MSNLSMSTWTPCCLEPHVRMSIVPMSPQPMSPCLTQRRGAGDLSECRPVTTLPHKCCLWWCKRVKMWWSKWVSCQWSSQWFGLWCSKWVWCPGSRSQCALLDPKRRAQIPHSKWRAPDRSGHPAPQMARSRSQTPLDPQMASFRSQCAFLNPKWRAPDRSGHSWPRKWGAPDCSGHSQENFRINVRKTVRTYCI